MPCQCDVPKGKRVEGGRFPKCETCGEWIMPVEFGGRERPQAWELHQQEHARVAADVPPDDIEDQIQRSAEYHQEQQAARAAGTPPPGGDRRRSPAAPPHEGSAP